MSFNRIDIQTRLSNFFNNPTYYTTENFNHTIQDGVDEIVAYCGTIIKSAVLQFIPNKTYYDMVSLLPDYIGLYAIFNPQIKKWLLPTSIRKLDQERLDWECCGGTPWYFTVVSHRYMAIYKKPLTTYGPMYVYYTAAAPTLVDSTGIDIPDDHIQVLQDYAVVDLLEQSQEFSKAAVHYQEYMKTLEDLRLYVQSKRNPGRFVILK